MVVRKLGRRDELRSVVEKAQKNGLLRIVKLSRECIEKGKCKSKTNLNEDVVINLKGVPLNEGDILEADNGLLILVELKEEKVIEFELKDPIEAFKLGFALGNYHMRVMLQGGKVYISSELGEEFLLERFKEYNPKVRELVFKPNLELPVSPVVIDFANT